jgi:AraC-like DNA-binding protein/quercetin dioxygenase-like cupin family protein
MSRKRHTLADEPYLIVRTLDVTYAAGTRTGAHAHDWHQLIHASTGVLNVRTGRGAWVLPAGRALWVPADIAHDIDFVGEARLRTLYVRPRPGDGLPDQIGVVAVSPLLRELILRATRDHALDERRPVDAALAAVILDEFRHSSAPPFQLPLPQSPGLHRAASLMADAAGAGMTALAQAAGFGKRTLERRFRAETGMSPARWRRHRRFLAAVERLASGTSVKTAAAEAGYASPSAFVAAFRREFGVTPARYFADD